MEHRKMGNDTSPPGIKKEGKRDVRRLVTAALVLVIMIHLLSPYPFTFAFRIYNNPQKSAVRIGPYAERIETVQTGKTATVSVKGYPNAKLTFFTPEKVTEPLPCILFIHGGGWIGESAGEISLFTKLLATNNCIVASLTYSLAPEYPYPASTFQAAAALNYLYSHAKTYKIDPTRMFIGGNSAGAHLSAQLGALVTNPDYAKEVGVTVKVPASSICGLILLNGIFDFESVVHCHFPGFFWMGWSYTGRPDYWNYVKIDEISPIRHITADFPPSFITAGDIDQLEPQSLEMDEALGDLGVDVTSVFWTDTRSNLWHDYIYHLDTEEAQTAYRSLEAFLAKHAAV